MKSIYIIILAVLCIGSGVWYFTDAHSNSSLDTAQLQAPESSEVFSGTNSFNELLARGENLRCEFTASDETMSSAGTFYIAENRFRIDAITTMPEGESETHMLATDDNFYVWNISQYGTFAFMIERDETELQNSESNTMDMDRKITYDCTNRKPAEDILTPPTDIEFTSMSDMFNAVTTDTSN